jgi:hypothetical protein
MHSRTGIRARRAKLRAMSWEALTAISTAFTGLVILVTVLFAARQVKVLNDQSKAMSAQLEHLRRATQLDGTLAIFDEVMLPETRDSYHFVMTEFDERMKDVAFRNEALERSPDPEVHKELYILRHMERIGTLVKNGLLDADVLFDFSGLFVRDCWRHLGTLALEQRRKHREPQLWENFERLAAQAERAATRGFEHDSR